MILLQKLESGLAARRAELINQPLARCWGELAKVAEEICNEHAIENGWYDA
jgi:hypothetical protein